MSESMALHWTDASSMGIDFTNKRPVFLIAAHAEKGKKNRVLPMAPEFAEFLERTPVEDRHGFVFNPRARGTTRPAKNVMSRTISQIGEAAGVFVGNDKSASAHDLRRSFGERWSWRVLPRVLQVLMRHRSIATTNTYYTGRDAQDDAESVWSAFDGLVKPHPLPNTSANLNA